MKTIAHFDIEFLQYLNEKHQPIQEFPPFADPQTLLQLYKLMALTRALDTKAVNLQRQGKMGTYPSSKGQEAVGVGIGHAMRKDDVFCPFYRDQGTFLVRGVKMSEILSAWGGDERGNQYKNPDIQEDFPICIPIAGQYLHAAGVAYALKYRRQPRVVVATGGDGSTSKGDFYEALNLAGAWHLPMVFVINNNQWAISVPRTQQTATQTLAQKAIAGGFKGLQVDGNDVIAVRQAVSEAVENARQGGGPTLIEAVTFRLCDHTTADDATRYCPEEDVKKAWKEEPIARLGYYLEAQGLWSKEKEAELLKECAQEVEKEVAIYLSTPKQSPGDLFDYLYKKLPDAFLDQRDLLVTQTDVKSH